MNKCKWCGKENIGLNKYCSRKCILEIQQLYYQKGNSFDISMFISFKSPLSDLLIWKKVKKIS